MDVREKLIDLLTGCSIDTQQDVEYVVDHLLSGGVTVQELDGCKYCKEYEDLPEHFIDGKPAGRVFDTCIQPNENGLWHIEVPCGADIGIRFCPMCGRRLPQPQKVAPVVHGRWIEQEKYTFGVMYDCSICGDRILDNGHSWNYCPNCGAKMDGGADL